MKKTFFLSLITLLVLSSCVSKKEYTSLENRHKKTQDLLNTATIKLNACLEEMILRNPGQWIWSHNRWKK